MCGRTPVIHLTLPIFKRKYLHYYSTYLSYYIAEWAQNFRLQEDETKNIPPDGNHYAKEGDYSKSE